MNGYCLKHNCATPTPAALNTLNALNPFVAKLLRQMQQLIAMHKSQCDSADVQSMLCSVGIQTILMADVPRIKSIASYQINLKVLIVQKELRPSRHAAVRWRK